MKRSATPTFILSIPLVVKPREDRILIGRMEASWKDRLDSNVSRDGNIPRNTQQRAKGADYRKPWEVLSAEGNKSRHATI